MAESEMTDDREFWQKELIWGIKSEGGRLVSSDETSAWQVSSVQGSAYLDDRKLRAKYFCRLRKSWQQLSSNENEAHLSLAVHTCLTENLWLPETKLWLLPESESSSRDAAARLKWDASNSSRSPLPLPSRTTQGLNQWE